MNKSSPFTVYNASAGSGKTFAITKNYLSLLLLANRPDAYRNILAVTFTNKAVEEMKTRIVDALAAFSEKETPKKFRDLLKETCKQTGLSEKAVREKSRIILETLLHDYSTFAVSTIDAFTNRVLRTFARDLGLQMNYEVEIDSGRVLSEAVARVIAQAGDDKELTKTLVDFAISKADDDKSWNIEYDLNEIAWLLVNENNRKALAVLGEKRMADFREFSNKLDKEIKRLKNLAVEKADCFFQLLEGNALDETCFSGKYVPKYFLKLQGKKGYERINFTNVKWQENIAGENLYNDKFPDKFPGKAATIDRLQPEIAELFFESKQAVQQFLYYKKIRGKLSQLSLMNHVRHEVEEIKREENILLIADFNDKIAQSIQGQPVPFVYERLGERYRHYFVDEFQDTSILQWENLQPLVSNWLSKEDEKQRTGTLTIVGDAKQAIYRWRGGDARQFMDLCAQISPFPGIVPDVKNLPSNYRSCKEIVDFNNAFFRNTAKYLGHETHKNLFEKAEQKVIKKTGGYVNISFVEKANKEEKTQAYLEKTLETIVHLTTNGYPKKDICILVRANSQGVALADFLSENKIDIISEETLLVRESPEVQFLNNLLGFSQELFNDELKLELLYFLLDKLPGVEPNGFLLEGLAQKGESFFGFLNQHGFQFELEHFRALPLYDAVEYSLRKFDLVSNADVFLQTYLDFLFDYSRSKSGGIPGFLEHWELHKDRLSVAAPEGKDAVRIMTIHKSKGLEFPIVIYPFAENPIDDTAKDKVWVELDEKFDFPYAYLNASSSLLDYGENPATVFSELKKDIELDAMNVLYVALTRAEKQLYIISLLENPGKNKDNHKYSHFFIEFLKSEGKWEEGKMDYGFGEFNPNLETEFPKEGEDSCLRRNVFISTDPATHNLKITTTAGSLWQTEQDEAIGKGTVLHEIMAMVSEKTDVEKALQSAIKTGLIPENEVSEMQGKILEIIDHPELKTYFELGNQNHTEREILFENSLLRPDRINLNDDMATIIDYKTGIPMEKHQQQINRYAEAVSGMGFQIKEKLLVYLNDKVELRRILS